MQPPPTVHPAVEVAQKTDPGRDPEKQVNEDICAYRVTRFGHLCVVCDGMGGHASGREASTNALETILQWFEAAPEGSSPPQVLHDARLRNELIRPWVWGYKKHPILQAEFVYLDIDNARSRSSP